MPLWQRTVLGAKCKLLSGIIGASTRLSDNRLIRSVRKLAGTNQFPMGQRFLEKALVSFKRALRQANPRCREKII